MALCQNSSPEINLFSRLAGNPCLGVDIRV